VRAAGSNCWTPQRGVEYGGRKCWTTWSRWQAAAVQVAVSSTHCRHTLTSLACLTARWEARAHNVSFKWSEQSSRCVCFLCQHGLNYHGDRLRGFLSWLSNSMAPDLSLSWYNKTLLAFPHYLILTSRPIVFVHCLLKTYAMNTQFVCNKIWGSRSDEHMDVCLLGCNTVWACK
jgi:hypothetical protein